MSFDDLYQEIILDHYRHPRNAAKLDHIGEENVHENPTCGDSVKLEVKVGPDGKIERVSFDGRGCAISMASASMMTDLMVGKSVEEAAGLSATFKAVMRGEGDPAVLEEWGDVAALRGVIHYPVRVKCATLAWNALQSTMAPAEP